MHSSGGPRLRIQCVSFQPPPQSPPLGRRGTHCHCSLSFLGHVTIQGWTRKWPRSWGWCSRHPGALFAQLFLNATFRGPGDTSAPGSSGKPNHWAEHSTLQGAPTLPPSPHWGPSSSSKAHPLLPAPVNPIIARQPKASEHKRALTFQGHPFLTTLSPLIHLRVSILLKYN